LNSKHYIIGIISPRLYGEKLLAVEVLCSIRETIGQFCNLSQLTCEWSNFWWKYL